MQNLAGHENSTAICARELQIAGIEIVPMDASVGEPRARVTGRIGENFAFRRAWYYWSVNGPVPLEVAKRLYEHPIGRRDVWVAGHCGCPPPEEWVRWIDTDGNEIVADPDGKRLAEWDAFTARHPKMNDDRPRFVPDPSAVIGARAYVNSYDVDSQEGLNLLAEALRGL
jgi:hypothetical protein